MNVVRETIVAPAPTTPSAPPMATAPVKVMHRAANGPTAQPVTTAVYAMTVLRVMIAEAGANSRADIAEFPECGRKDFDGERRGVSDVDFPAVPGGESAGHTLCLLRARQNGFRLGKKHAALTGKVEGLCRAIEKRQPELVFEVSDLAAQRRLRNMQALGRAGDVFLFRDGDEIAQVPELHRRRLCPKGIAGQAINAGEETLIAPGGKFARRGRRFRREATPPWFLSL